MSENAVQTMESLVGDFSKGAIAWYDFRNKGNILYLYTEDIDASVVEFLESKGRVDIYDASHMQSDDLRAREKYTYIVGIDIIEVSRQPIELLKLCRACLKPDGRLLLGTENRYAVKYICGDRDPYTDHSFDGVENYRRLTEADWDVVGGRCYSMVELQDMLRQAGFVSNKFYSAMPSLQETQLVYATNYEPVEELAMRYFPLYNYPDSVFLEEQFLYTDLIKNRLFHKLANAYIIECSMDGRLDTTLHATISLDRGRQNALVTSICEQEGVKTVSKKALYKEGLPKLEAMQDNLLDLRERGIHVVDANIVDGCFVMPFVDAPIAMNALKDLAKNNKEVFYKALDDMYELILQSSEHTDVISEKDRNSANGRDLGIILKKGYIDLVPLNCFYDAAISEPKDRFIYYDQEFYIENCPAKAIMYRSLLIIYDGTDKEFENRVPKKEAMARYGLLECEDIWSRMAARFTDTLRNQSILRLYYEHKRADGRVLNTNREKINYSTKDYQRIFVDIFAGLDTKKGRAPKKLILFGSGRFTERFLFQFADDYEIYSIIDNNSAKWGTEMEGIPVNPPTILNDILPEERHIIICIKGYNGVVKQLEDMGIHDYHIFDPGNDYPNKRKELVAAQLAVGVENADNTMERADDGKRYNVGYIAGVFDLFHIGHLNMFKRAKEQCRYLIVGVVSDEGVRLNKQAEPFVPFDERIEMVRSCKYVDEAIKLPLNLSGTRDIFKRYHFDVQFSGSDYENDPAWLADKEFLEKNGSTMVFFPYTQTTSSTKLKKAINEALGDRG